MELHSLPPKVHNRKSSFNLANRFRLTGFAKDVYVDPVRLAALEVIIGSHQPRETGFRQLCPEAGDETGGLIESYTKSKIAIVHFVNDF